MQDVIIAGAGPVGLYLAGLLESKVDVLILERSKLIGHKICSGLVSTRLSNFFRIDRRWVEHKVRGAVLHSPGGLSIKVSKKGVAAYVINRHRFDRWLAGQVKSRILLGTEVKGVRVGDFAEVVTNRGKFRSRLIVGADGCNSLVGRGFGGKPREVLNGLIAVTDERDFSENVEMWYNPRKLPEGFWWKIPRGKQTEYGMLGRRVSFRQLEQFFGLKNYKRGAAPIPLGGAKSFSDRILLVGDAAGQTKPWSGGGLVYGFIAARIAARVILKALGSDFSKDVLAEYERGWKRVLGGSIKGGMWMRKFYSRMPNVLIDGVFGLIRIFQSRMDKIDMDFPI